MNEPDHWAAERYASNARFVSELGAGVLDWLAPQPGERILDLGCGDGALTQKLVAAGATVHACDASRDMVAAARAAGLDAEQIDGHDLTYEREFDAVFSNAALHWMTRPDAVITGVARSLVPGGRFVAEFGGQGNVAAIRVALDAALTTKFGIEDAPSRIWYFPSVAEHRARLEAGGFEVERIELIPRPTPLPGEMADWLETLAAPILASVSPAEAAVARDAAVKLLRPALCDSHGNWTADYVRLRFAARLKS